MKKHIVTILFCLLSFILFTPTTFADSPYILKVTVQNKLTSDFVFSSEFPSGNSCKSLGPNTVLCTISGFTVPEAAKLEWTNQKTPGCSISIVVMPYAAGKSGYTFIHWGTGGGNTSPSGYTYSFPTTWDGASNLSTDLVISGVTPGAQCAD